MPFGEGPGITIFHFFKELALNLQLVKSLGCFVTLNSQGNQDNPGEDSYYALISTSTPLGRSSFDSASTVRDEEVYISSRRLWVHN